MVLTLGNTILTLSETGHSAFNFLCRDRHLLETHPQLLRGLWESLVRSTKLKQLDVVLFLFLSWLGFTDNYIIFFFPSEISVI